jgi:hypothetical protein
MVFDFFVQENKEQTSTNFLFNAMKIPSLKFHDTNA